MKNVTTITTTEAQPYPLTQKALENSWCKAVQAQNLAALIQDIVVPPDTTDGDDKGVEWLSPESRFALCSLACEIEKTLKDYEGLIDAVFKSELSCGRG